MVSIDGLQPEHDIRRAPATYERILKNIASQNITIHCTVTGQMMKRPSYLKEFLEFWTPRCQIRKVWFSLFTPQAGDYLPEVLQPHERLQTIADMLTLRKKFSKLDMPEGLIRQFAMPPQNPNECIFARTTQTLSADLKTNARRNFRQFEECCCRPWTLINGIRSFQRKGGYFNIKVAAIRTDHLIGPLHHPRWSCERTPRRVLE